MSPDIRQLRAATLKPAQIVQPQKSSVIPGQSNATIWQARMPSPYGLPRMPPKGQPFPPQETHPVPGMPGWYTVPPSGMARGPALPVGVWWIYDASGRAVTYSPPHRPGAPR